MLRIPESCGAEEDAQTVTFSVECRTSPGEELMLVGSIRSLGSWDLSHAVRMSTLAEEYPVWTSPAIPLAAGGPEEVGPVMYKYVLTRAHGEDHIWEEGSDRIIAKDELVDVCQQGVIDDGVFRRGSEAQSSSRRVKKRHVVPRPKHRHKSRSKSRGSTSLHATTETEDFMRHRIQIEELQAKLESQSCVIECQRLEIEELRSKQEGFVHQSIQIEELQSKLERQNCTIERQQVEIEELRQQLDISKGLQEQLDVRMRLMDQMEAELKQLKEKQTSYDSQNRILEQQHCEIEELKRQLEHDKVLREQADASLKLQTSEQRPPQTSEHRLPLLRWAASARTPFALLLFCIVCQRYVSRLR
eukprot:TRINITY_DN100256_c0_g1_i1.p1 TRINITY_DN100256_c0_g1~~TRINITY_DN100256_c0_g1_i1.p1  ORF type:complete len:359 (+),score=69.71 TRINITY_DN100256_c0_g1_i1:47-1123(+)